MKKLIPTSFLVLATLYAAKGPTQMAVTSAEVAFRYSRPDTTACTWEMSTSSTYSPLVDNLVNNQTDSGAVGERWFIVIALGPSTLYYWRQTCGTEVYTGTFTTRPLETAPSGSSAHISLGGAPSATSATFQYGGTTTLGNSLTVPCTPACTADLPVATGALLFYRYAYYNGADAVTGLSPLQVTGW
jgi:hypothetical protein